MNELIKEMKAWVKTKNLYVINSEFGFQKGDIIKILKQFGIGANMYNYDSYLKHSAGATLPVEEALQIYNDILESVRMCKVEDKDEFVGEFVKKACNYAKERLDWEFYSREEQMAADQGRTIKHNAFIDSVNILARLLNSDGIETPWRERLGDERKRIGDFACFVAYIVGISNR